MLRKELMPNVSRWATEGKAKGLHVDFERMERFLLFVLVSCVCRLLAGELDVPCGHVRGFVGGL